jgi:hypothetical protein
MTSTLDQSISWNGQGRFELLEVIPNLRSRSQSLHIQEVGHARESGVCEKWGRRIGLLVVMLTTAIGTTTFTQLGKSPSTGIKIALGSISMLAAVLAAYKENAAFGKSSADHGKAAAVFGQLHHRAENLIFDLKRGNVSFDLDKELRDLNKDEADAMSTSIPLRPGRYDWARRWVEREQAGSI